MIIAHSSNIFLRLYLFRVSLYPFFFVTFIATENVIFIAVPLGSIAELPALSCHEIKLSEGKDTISKMYWFDPTSTGKAELLYCDMKLEGK